MAPLVELLMAHLTAHAPPAAKERLSASLRPRTRSCNEQAELATHVTLTPQKDPKHRATSAPPPPSDPSSADIHEGWSYSAIANWMPAFDDAIQASAQDILRILGSCRPLRSPSQTQQGTFQDSPKPRQYSAQHSPADSASKHNSLHASPTRTTLFGFTEPYPLLFTKLHTLSEPTPFSPLASCISPCFLPTHPTHIVPNNGESAFANSICCHTPTTTTISLPPIPSTSSFNLTSTSPSDPTTSTDTSTSDPRPSTSPTGNTIAEPNSNNFRTTSLSQHNSLLAFPRHQ